MATKPKCSRARLVRRVSWRIRLNLASQTLRGALNTRYAALPVRRTLAARSQK